MECLKVQHTINNSYASICSILAYVMIQKQYVTSHDSGIDP